MTYNAGIQRDELKFLYAQQHLQFALHQHLQNDEGRGSDQ